ncbi:ribosome biogenesis GTP-binding protein YihA/YsxC [Pseudothermotoga sp. U03pept]|uniref:ribosome biogenesis GTP-binding protein YihA/YsxC n=1 Tax=Pseudothermotoga sp. U03pept TaxID=3447012 RepID=UPI003F067241
MFVKDVEFVVSAYDEKHFPKPLDGEVCFVGRSNVGKSTLLNVLFGRRIARVSKTPGKTKSINFYLVNKRFYFVDLPGYGYAKRSKHEIDQWRDLIERYFKYRKTQIKLCVLLIDSRLSPQESDTMFVEWSRYFGTPIVVVLSKVDKIKKSEFAKRIEVVGEHLGVEAIGYSAITKLGVDKIVQKIERALS